VDDGGKLVRSGTSIRHSLLNQLWMSLHTGRNVVLQTYDNFLSRRLAAVWLSDELYKVRLFGNFL